MADNLPNILTSSEVKSLRHDDGGMERTGVIRSVFRVSWENAKGAMTGGALGLLGGAALAVGVVAAGAAAAPLIPLALGAPFVFSALGAVGGGLLNTGWGIRAKGSDVKRDNEAIQRAALAGAQHGPDITREQLQGLAPRRSLLKGVMTAAVVGAAVVAGAAAMVAAPPVALAIAAGAGAALFAAGNAARNHARNETMSATLEKAASLGAAKARSQAFERGVQQQRAQQKAPGKYQDLGGLAAPETPLTPQPQGKSAFKQNARA